MRTKPTSHKLFEKPFSSPDTAQLTSFSKQRSNDEKLSRKNATLFFPVHSSSDFSSRHGSARLKGPRQGPPSQKEIK